MVWKPWHEIEGAGNHVHAMTRHEQLIRFRVGKLSVRLVSVSGAETAEKGVEDGRKGDSE